MTVAKAVARPNKTFTVQTWLTIITYDCQFFIVKATDLLFKWEGKEPILALSTVCCYNKLVCFVYDKHEVKQA